MQSFGKVYVTENWSSRTHCTLTIDNQESDKVQVTITVRAPDQNAGGMEPDKSHQTVELKPGKKDTASVIIAPSDSCTIKVVKFEVKTVKTSLGERTL